MTWILGIGGFSHDASATLVNDGRLIAAVQEERLTRVKHVGGFPYKSIEYCLDTGDIGPDDVAAIAFYAKKSNWDRYLAVAVRASIRHFATTVSNPRGFIATIGYRVYRSLVFRAEFERFFHETGFDRHLFRPYDHHACHAAAAFYSSPFDDAIILCIDGGGDGKTTSGWVGRGNKLQEIPLGIRHPHSMGLVYTRMTRYLGFMSSGDEYKVMGLAAYGKPVYLDRLRDMIRFRPDGTYRLNMDFFNYQFEYSLSKRFYGEFGPARKKGEEITQRHADLAASVQRLFEEVVLHVAHGLKKKTGINHLAVSGGSALNCTANGRLLLSGEFDGVFVPASASDIGASAGAAQYHSHQVLGIARRGEIKTDAWGPEYGDDDILDELNRSGIKYERLTNPAKTAAELVASGNIVGWFQGRMEFGPRALGSRSIVADARRKDVKDRVNMTVKFREEFRPFAPSVLNEHVKSYFGVDGQFPFMTFTLDVLPDKRSEIPGVVHVDGTARVQTVSRVDHPLYYKLIEHFYQLVGVPVVLNTSFNLAGEPIVCSPFDALRTFFTCGIDVLILGRFLVAKKWPVQTSFETQAGES